MATLNGMMRFSGQLGELVFYRRGKTDVVRQKAAAYTLSENSRKSAADFGAASRNGAYIRKAFAPMVKRYGYGDLHNRLNKKLVDVFKTIPAACAGQKKLQDGNISLLQGFEFNAATWLDHLLLQKPQFSLAGPDTMVLQLPKTDILQLVKRIPKADACVLQVMLFNFDVDSGQYEIISINDLRLSFEQADFPGAQLQVPFAHQGDRLVLVAMGISYLHREVQKADRRYFACQLAYCRHLKDGVEVAFIPPVAQVSAPIQEAEAGISWTLASPSGLSDSLEQSPS